MRKTLSVTLILAVVLGAFAVVPAQAKKRKKKPVPVTFYAHGNLPIGEMEIADAIDGRFMPMNADEPTESSPKSMGLTNYAGGPNPMCSGNPFFPVWVGDMAGTVTGDMKFTFNVVAAPAGQVEVRVFPDAAPLSCNESYNEPGGAVTVDLPAGSGTVEAVIKGVNFPVAGHLMIQVSPVIPGPTQGRVLYDATSAATQLKFMCVPASGTSCTT